MMKGAAAGMKMKAAVMVVAVLVLVLVLVAGVAVEGAVTCSPVQLSPCASAITTSRPPSGLCCQRIRQQKPCMCGYLKNPTLRKFVDNPNARKVANQCKVPFPKC